MDRFAFHLIAALAEFEGTSIFERPRSDVAIARRQGHLLERLRALNHAQTIQARVLLQTRSFATVARLLNVSVRHCVGIYGNSITHDWTESR